VCLTGWRFRGHGARSEDRSVRTSITAETVEIQGVGRFDNSTGPLSEDSLSRYAACVPTENPHGHGARLCSRKHESRKAVRNQGVALPKRAIPATLREPEKRSKGQPGGQKTALVWSAEMGIWICHLAPKLQYLQVRLSILPLIREAPEEPLTAFRGVLRSNCPGSLERP
jgi:hypothetical protein